MPRELKSALSEPLDPSDEKELALAFNRGEPDAYRAIYDRYQHRVNSLCRRLLNDPHDAQEASQEVFTRVYQALPRFNGRYQLGAWIVRIATNVCLDQIRSRNRRPCEAAPIEELHLDMADGLVADEPETMTIRKAESRHVRRVLQGLPPMHRAAIVLRDFEGLPYQDVAIALGITEGQTKALIHRARQNFKRTWAPLETLQAVLPWKLLQKVRKVDVSAGDGATQVVRASGPLTEAATSVSQLANAASSCSLAVQQCGQFMAERATALAATVIVGTAAIGGVAAGSAAEATRPRETHVIEESSLQIDLLSTAVARKTSRRSSAHRTTHATSHVPVREEAPAEAVPEPAAVTPSPSPSSPPDDAPEPEDPAAPKKNEGGGPAESPPPPFLPSVFFGDQEPTGASQVRSHSFSLDCAASTFEQLLVTSVTFDGQSYPATLGLRAWNLSGRIELTVTKDAHDVRYSSWGPEPVGSWSRNGSSARAVLAGEYGAISGSDDPAEAGLPSSGNFQVELMFDCSTSRVSTEHVAFSTP